MTEEALGNPIYTKRETDFSNTVVNADVRHWELNNFDNAWMIALKIIKMDKEADLYHGIVRVFSWNVFNRETGSFEVNPFEINFDDQKGERILLRNMSEILQAIGIQSGIQERLPRVIGDFAKLK